MATEYDEWQKQYALSGAWTGDVGAYGRAAFAAGRAAGLEEAAQACRRVGRSRFTADLAPATAAIACETAILALKEKPPEATR